MKNYNIHQLINQNSASRFNFNINFDESHKNHQLPISIIKGKEKGKVITLIAGIHGYEYPPIIALQQILNEIKPNLLKGTLIILPVANLCSFFQRVPFVHPDDKKNLNKVFPGTASGSISERIAHWITKNIFPHTDILIDIHGGDANEDLVPFACYYHNQHHLKNTEIAKKLCEISGLPYIVSYPYDISIHQPALYAFKQATQNNIVSLSLEAGKLGNLQKTCVEQLKNAIYNILDFSNTYLQNQPIKIEKKQIFLKQQTYIQVPIQGIFYSQHQSGDFIKTNEHLGYITDIFGNILQHIVSPTTGFILYKIGTPPVNKGETLFCIGSEKPHNQII